MLLGVAKAQSVPTDAIFGKLRLGMDQRPAHQSSEGWKGAVRDTLCLTFTLAACGVVETGGYEDLDEFRAFFS